MDCERWERIQSLFHRATELDATEQLAFLKSECGDDTALIAAVVALITEDVAASSLLDRDMSDLASQLLGAPAHDLASKQFGPYRLGRLLGEGGSGVVYLAERADLQSQVAIKFLRDAWLSPARRERFTAEQRTLAQLNHPSIARLYDAGTLDDGTPWFVMEYVEGLPLAAYCTTHASSIEERLRLFRAVCEAVAYAHDHGIIHRDLKPSNILVKADGSVRLLDFGIAKQLAPPEGDAGRTHTGLRLMTPAYASPEQIRGERVDVASDIYSLGVVLYELITGRQPFDVSSLTPGEALTFVVEHEPEKPSTVAPGLAARSSRADLDVLCVTAMHKESTRRYATVNALIRDVDHFLKSEPLDARADTYAYTVGKFVRRNGVQLYVAAVVVAAIGAAWLVGKSIGVAPSGSQAPAETWRTVAVLPFHNASSDASLDFLRLALPDEVATILSHTRSVSVRSFAATRKYDKADVDVQQAGREMRVATVVTGRFLRAGDVLRITIEATDVNTGRSLWRDLLDAPANSLIATQTQIGLRVRGGLAAALGWPDADAIGHPKSEEAYGLFLRSAAQTLDAKPNAQAIEMLERSVELDPSYAPAWHTLGRRYYVDARYGNGPGRLTQFDAAMQKALAIEPGYIAAGAGLVVARVEAGELVKAHEQAADLVRRRPDSIDAHFVLSYVLRFAGLLEESADQCNTALLLDSRTQTTGLRSCSVAFVLRGDYKRAMNFVDLDSGSDWAKAMSINMLVRDGKQKEALALGTPHIPGWNSYDLLLACVQRKPPAEVVALAASVKPSEDPETNYFSATHLAFCGQTKAALAMLETSVRGKYCSYPAMDTDPYFADLWKTAEFARIRAAGLACQNDFRARTK